MKSNSHNAPSAAEFWSWFRAVADSLEVKMENPSLLAELDRSITKLHPSISWELGPGIKKACQLVISPNLNAELFPFTREIVGHAPQLDNWEFYAARQPKPWDYRLEVEDTSGSALAFDTSSWTYVLLRYPSGKHEILIKSTVPLPSDKDTGWQIGAIILESILGEETLLDKIDSFTVVDRLEAKFEGKDKPIKELRRAFLQ